MGRPRITPLEFLARAATLHNNAYDYTDTCYTGMHSTITVNCPQHGAFSVMACNHVKRLSNSRISPAGCPQCGAQKVVARNRAGRKPYSQFVQEANEVHGGMYIYDETTYTGINNLITMVCCIHGEFRQQGMNHLRGTGCPRCKNSKGETRIARILDNLNIIHTRQYSFSDCVGDSGKPLKFDFWLPSHNTLIEYDGEQHFRPVRFHQQMSQEIADQMFDRTRQYDDRKNRFAASHSINLVRVPYYQIKDAGQIIRGAL